MARLEVALSIIIYLNILEQDLKKYITIFILIIIIIKLRSVLIINPL